LTNTIARESSGLVVHVLFLDVSYASRILPQNMIPKKQEPGKVIGEPKNELMKTITAHMRVCCLNLKVLISFGMSWEKDLKARV
jgi:hypothetical protein